MGMPVTGSDVSRTPALLGGSRAFEEPVYVTRPRIPEEGVFQNLLATIFHSRRLTNNGPLVQELEAQLRGRLGVPLCLVFCNGTIALQVALRALDLAGEVITTPFTFPATLHAIEWNGLTPVFCDIEPDTYNLDVSRAADLLTDRTTALLPVHVFGNPCDVVRIGQLGEARGVRIIYDAAHAFGVSHRGRPIGCWGDLSVLSFHATKLFHTCEGGAIVGPAERWNEEIALLRNFGIVNQERVRGVGLNGKLSELHAAVGLSLLDSLNDEAHARASLESRYRERLSGTDGLKFQSMAPDTVPNHAYLTIEIDDESFGLSRNELHTALLAENIVTRKYFFPLCSENESYRHLESARPELLPNAHLVASRILCLPIYGDLELDDVDKVIDCLLAIRSCAPRIRKAAGRSSN